jgi:antitoxin component YwqK of YwqJK toxin-antitoxin module
MIDLAKASTDEDLRTDVEATACSTAVSPAGFLHNDHSSAGTDTGAPSASFFAEPAGEKFCALIFRGSNKTAIKAIIRIMTQITPMPFFKNRNVKRSLILCQVFCCVTVLAFGQKQKDDPTIQAAPSNAQGQVVEGRKEGKWTYYFNDGKISAIEHFKGGMLDGTVEYFYPGGNRQGIENWRNGMMEDSATYWHQNGKVDKRGKYEQGQYAGEWRHYFENGKPERIVNYVGGLPEGSTKAFYESGGLMQDGFYKQGKEDGEWKFYNEKGDLEFIAIYREGKELEMKKVPRKAQKSRKP